jgi:bifunctional non-homologous end joining protein LigD
MKWRALSGSITLPAPGFVESCVPTPAKAPPSGGDWVYELKMDGYRKDGQEVRVYSRRGPTSSSDFPAWGRLPAGYERSRLLDGEGIVYDQNGMPDFNLVHSKEYDREVSLVALI